MRGGLYHCITRKNVILGRPQTPKRQKKKTLLERGGLLERVFPKRAIFGREGHTLQGGKGMRRNKGGREIISEACGKEVEKKSP